MCTGKSKSCGCGCALKKPKLVKRMSIGGQLTPDELLRQQQLRALQRSQALNPYAPTAPAPIQPTVPGLQLPPAPALPPTLPAAQPTTSAAPGGDGAGKLGAIVGAAGGVASAIEGYSAASKMAVPDAAFDPVGAQKAQAAQTKAQAGAVTNGAASVAGAFGPVGMAVGAAVKIGGAAGGALRSSNEDEYGLQKAGLGGQAKNALANVVDPVDGIMGAARKWGDDDYSTLEKLGFRGDGDEKKRERIKAKLSYFGRQKGDAAARDAYGALYAADGGKLTKRKAGEFQLENQLSQNRQRGKFDKPYMIVDDRTSQGYLISNDHTVTKQFPVITGQNPGEKSAETSRIWRNRPENKGKSFEQYVDHLTATKQRITPSGEFEMSKKDLDPAAPRGVLGNIKQAVHDSGLGAVLNATVTDSVNYNVRGVRHESYGDRLLDLKDPATGQGIGPAVHGTGHQNRLDALKGYDLSARKLSAGCVNCAPEDLQDVYSRLGVGSRAQMMPEDSTRTVAQPVLQRKKAAFALGQPGYQPVAESTGVVRHRATGGKLVTRLAEGGTAPPVPPAPAPRARLLAPKRSAYDAGLIPKDNLDPRLTPYSPAETSPRRVPQPLPQVDAWGQPIRPKAPAAPALRADAQYYYDHVNDMNKQLFGSGYDEKYKPVGSKGEACTGNSCLSYANTVTERTLGLPNNSMARPREQLYNPEFSTRAAELGYSVVPNEQVKTGDRLQYLADYNTKADGWKRAGEGGASANGERIPVHMMVAGERAGKSPDGREQINVFEDGYKDMPVQSRQMPLTSKAQSMRAYRYTGTASSESAWLTTPTGQQWLSSPAGAAWKAKQVPAAAVVRQAEGGRLQPRRAAAQDATAPRNMYRSTPAGGALYSNNRGSFQGAAAVALRKALPLNVAMGIQDVTGNKTPLTEKDLSNEEINALRYAARKARPGADPENATSIKQFGVSTTDPNYFGIQEHQYRTEGAGLAEKITNPDARMSTTIGGATITKTGHGNDSQVTDTFDFNDKGNNDPFSLEDLTRRGTAYSKIRYVAGYVGSAEGKGIPSKINLGNLKRPRTGEKFADGGQLQPRPGGLFSNNKPAFVDSVHHANRGLDFVKRMYEHNTPTLQVRGNRYPSTHEMESSDNRAYPTDVRLPGQKGLTPLHQNRDQAYDYANKSREYIAFKKPEQAEWYAANGYKQGTGMLPGLVQRHKRGGSLIADGHLHSEKHDHKGKELGTYGVPVLDASTGSRSAEIEREELVLGDHATERLEQLYDRHVNGDTKAATRAGLLLKRELTENTQPSKKYQKRLQPKQKVKLDQGGALIVLGKDGEAQAALGGGNRVFSRHNTRELVTRSLTARDGRHAHALGKRAFTMLKVQDNNETEYASS